MILMPLMIVVEIQSRSYNHVAVHQFVTQDAVQNQVSPRELWCSGGFGNNRGRYPL